jgi:hypothetical protein
MSTGRQDFTSLLALGLLILGDYAILWDKAATFEGVPRRHP